MHKKSLNLIFGILIGFSFPMVSCAQSIEVIDTAGLGKIIHEKDNKIHIINFWATWCKPCVQELPYFENVNNKANAEVILVSLDFLEDLDTKVKDFIVNHDILSRVCLLDNIDYNSWINHVDNSWSGAIPATLLINSNTGKKIFIERQLKDGELDNMIKVLDD